jgi:hypothetical protein
MPDKSNLEYLISSNVTSSWTDDYNGTGVHGCIITGKSSFSSTSLFLPAAGVCISSQRMLEKDSTSMPGDVSGCWSRSVYSDDPNNAWYLYFGDDDQSMDGNFRFCGLSVRPVLVIPE